MSNNIGQARLRRLLQERSPLPRLHRPQNPLTRRCPGPRIRSQRCGPDLRCHLQLRRAASAPYPRLPYLDRARLASRPPLRFQSRRPRSVHRPRGQHLQMPPTGGAQNFPVAEDLAVRAHGSGVPPAAARPSDDVCDDRAGDARAAAGD